MPGAEASPESADSSALDYQFLRVLGHDLRGPLNVMALAADILISEGEKMESVSPMVLKAAERIRRQSERMNAMISRLGEFARGRMAPFEPAELSAGEVCKEVANKLRKEHPDRVIELRTQGNDRGMWDHAGLEQAVGNLLANALDHGEGTVTVTCAERDGMQLIRVNNPGPVISPERLPRMFEPFRGDKKLKKTTSGLGLGLYMTKHIAERHGGSVSVTSTETEGTDFTILLPKSP